MRFWHAGEVGLLLATIVIVAKLAAAASSDENLFDLNASNGEDWTLDAATGTDPYVDGGDTIALNSGISYEPLSEDIASANLPADNQQLFLNDSDDPQSNDLLLADLVADGKGGECSTSNMPGRKRRRNTMCSSSVGIVTSFPSQSILDASAFDSLYCPTASITIKSLFVCSSPDPRKTVYGYAVWTLYESTRVIGIKDAENCKDPSALYCCQDWIPTTSPIESFDVSRMSIEEILTRPRPSLELTGIGIGCLPFGPFVRRHFPWELPNGDDDDGDGS